jgi:hypothetical protein
VADVPGGDSHKCDECGIEFARSSDASRHRNGVHYTASPGIRAAIRKLAIAKLAEEDRELLDRLGDT